MTVNSENGNNDGVRFMTAFQLTAVSLYKVHLSCMLQDDHRVGDANDMAGVCCRIPWTLRDSVVVGQQLAAGMAAVHERGFLHGDLKPNNVGVSRSAQGDLQVKLLDFGRALPHSQGTLTWNTKMP